MKDRKSPLCQQALTSQGLHKQHLDAHEGSILGVLLRAKHIAVVAAGSSREQQAATRNSRQQQAAAGDGKQQQAGGGSRQQTVTCLVRYCWRLRRCWAAGLLQPWCRLQQWYAVCDAQAARPCMLSARSMSCVEQAGADVCDLPKPQSAGAFRSGVKREDGSITQCLRFCGTADSHKICVCAGRTKGGAAGVAWVASCCCCTLCVACAEDKGPCMPHVTHA